MRSPSRVGNSLRNMAAAGGWARMKSALPNTYLEATPRYPARYGHFAAPHGRYQGRVVPLPVGIQNTIFRTALGAGGQVSQPYGGRIWKFPNATQLNISIGESVSGEVCLRDACASVLGKCDIRDIPLSRSKKRPIYSDCNSVDSGWPNYYWRLGVPSHARYTSLPA